MSPSPILAYVDPGSGNLILQVIAGFFLGSLFYAKRAWAWLRSRKAKAAPKSKAHKKASGE